MHKPVVNNSINPGTHCSFRNPERFRNWETCSTGGGAPWRKRDGGLVVPLVKTRGRVFLSSARTLVRRVREKVFDPFLQRAVRTIGCDRLRHLVRHQEPHATSPPILLLQTRGRPSARSSSRFRIRSDSLLSIAFHDGKFPYGMSADASKEIESGGQRVNRDPRRADRRGFGSGRWTVERKRVAFRVRFKN